MSALSMNALKILGFGGSGVSALGRLSQGSLGRLPCVVIDSDAQMLERSQLSSTLTAGLSVTHGLGTGGDPALGREAMASETTWLDAQLEGVEVLFLVGGLGGGFASGAIPYVTERAAALGVITIAFCSMPFALEGARRREVAETALADLRKHCHAAVPLPNDLLLQQVGEDISVLEAFKQADAWMGRGIGAVATMLLRPGLVNIDLADLRAALSATGGRALFGLASGRSAEDALNRLMLCPLLQLPEYGYHADGLMLQITAGPELSLHAAHDILSFVVERFGGKGNTCLGLSTDPRYKGTVALCVLGVSDIGRSPHKTPKQRLSKTPEAFDEQDEFQFMSQGQLRGYFDKTQRNYFDGEDLDVPTYIRKGIKISL